MIAMVSHDLLATKFFVPSVKSNLVKRDRLVQYLHQGTKGKLTLISAPAGFGKTTLLAEWLNQTELPHTWLSLDERDNNPTRFWQYIIAALQKVQPQLGKKTLEILKNLDIKDEVDEFWANIATLKSYLSHEQDITEAIHLAEEALQIVPKYSYWLRSLLLMNLGGSYYFIDRFEQAETILAQAVEVSTHCKQVDKINPTYIDRTSESAVTSLCLRAELKELHGDFAKAIAFSQEALEIVTKRHWLENTSGIIVQYVYILTFFSKKVTIDTEKKSFISIKRRK